MNHDRLRAPVRALALLFALLFALSSLTPAAQAAERQTVRVGFFSFDGYHMTSENGVRSGYGYEFLRLAARYMDVDYEYVGYDRGWEDMLTMLEAGEIDLVTSAQATPERMADFTFSKPIGQSSAILTASSSNNTIVARNYATYDGARIGLLEGSSRNDDLAEFAELKGFTYTPLYYSLAEDLESALQAGLVDLALTSSLRKTQRERVVDQFASHDFYVMVRKEDTALLAQLNYAIEQLNAVEGDWQNDLKNKYYTHLPKRDLALTAQEQALLQEYRRGEKTLVVSACTDKKPYAYVENGVAKGIMFDYFAQLAEYIDIPYTLITPADRAEYIEWCEAGLVDLCLDGRFQSYTQAELLRRTISAPYTTMRLAMVTRRDFDGQIETLAVSEAQGLFGIEDGLAPGAARVSYPSREAAMQAVLDGDADASIVYLYTAQQFVNQDERGLLTFTMLSEPTFDYHLSFSDNVSHALSGIFTKAIYAMPEGLFEDIASRHTSYKATDVDLLTWMEIYPLPTILVFLFVFLLLTLAVILVSHQSRVRLEARRAQQLQAMAEQTERANRAKSDFLANISHDLRTPMNAIVGIARLMQQEPALTQQQHEHLQKIQNASDHLLSLIDDVLDMRTIEAKQITLKPEPLSLRAQLAQLRDIMQTDAAARNQTLRVDAASLRHDVVRVDGARLRQVLLNLLSNAVKYTPDGGTIELRLRELDQPDETSGLFCFYVEDNGCGMPQELLDRLFEPFARGEASVTNKIQGAGLGMAITKNIVDVMGGQLTVRSTVGEGSCFELTLQLPLADAAQDAPAAAPTQMLAGLHFLCAEDNALNAEILNQTLTFCGARCTLCADGAQTVETFRAAPPDTFDAILMDIQMPNMDGLEAARAIRALPLDHAGRVPIFAMSANTSAADVQHSLDAGMNAHLCKPLDLAALCACLTPAQGS